MSNLPLAAPVQEEKLKHIKELHKQAILTKLNVVGVRTGMRQEDSRPTGEVVPVFRRQVLRLEAARLADSVARA